MASQGSSSRAGASRLMATSAPGHCTLFAPRTVGPVQGLALEAQVLRGVRAGTRTFVLDLHAVETVMPGFAGMLARVQRGLRAIDGSLRLESAPPDLREAVTLLGMETLLGERPGPVRDS